VGYVCAVRHASLRTVGLVAALAAATLGACGDDGGGPTAGTGSSTTATPGSTSTTTAATASSTTAAPSGATTVVPTTPPGTDLGTPTLDDASTVSTTGLDTVTFGMSLPQAERAAGTRLLQDPSAATTGDCAVVVPESGPAGVSFTVYKGTIERVDLAATAKIKTRSGAGVSTAVTQLKTLYGDRIAAAAGSTTYVFTPVDAADAAFRVVFETDGTAVTTAVRPA
jgi:hypothetical protein